MSDVTNELVTLRMSVNEGSAGETVSVDSVRARQLFALGFADPAEQGETVEAEPVVETVEVDTVSDEPVESNDEPDVQSADGVASELAGVAEGNGDSDENPDSGSRAGKVRDAK